MKTLSIIAVLLLAAPAFADDPEKDRCELQVVELRMQLMTAAINFQQRYHELEQRRDALKAKVDRAMKEKKEKAAKDTGETKAK